MRVGASEHLIFKAAHVSPLTKPASTTPSIWTSHTNDSDKVPEMQNRSDGGPREIRDDEEDGYDNGEVDDWYDWAVNRAAAGERPALGEGYDNAKGDIARPAALEYDQSVGGYVQVDEYIEGGEIGGADKEGKLRPKRKAIPERPAAVDGAGVRFSFFGCEVGDV